MTDKTVIENIETRTRQLIEEHRRLKKFCTELTAQRDALRDENRTLERRIRELDAQVARMQLAGGLAGESSDRDKARARVNRLMREVDKCLALLERPEPETQQADEAADGPEDA
ncbi:MAG: hypothetical protein K2N04_07535 [Alistipes sp.]|nr:hypothetical protein [Alistipes sp.]